MLLSIKFATKIQQKFQITKDFAIIFFIRDSFSILTHCLYDYFPYVCNLYWSMYAYISYSDRCFV